MQVQDHAEITHLLAELRLEHRELDATIAQLASGLGRDELQLTRLKKRKLLLKDAIARLESKQIPDLDAKLAAPCPRSSRARCTMLT
jgi:hypothetical protein